MQRRDFIQNTSLIAASLALNPWFKSYALDQKLNVLVLLTDDQRFDTIAALGNPDIITPNFDELVKNGTTFTNAHVMGGLSGAICQPSRAMLLTGRTLFNLDRQARDNNEYSFDIFNNYITFPELLKNQGYKTVGIGKQHNGTAIYARAFSDGAKVFFGGMSDQNRVPVQDFSADGKYPVERTYYMEDEHSSKLFADETVRFIEKYKSDPFLIYTAFTTPHDPRTAPNEYSDWYDENKLKLTPNVVPEHPFDNGELKVRDELLAPFPRTESDTRKQLKEYYATTSHLDAQIGRIIKSLKDNGVYENTVIVFAGDNGLAVGQHGLFGKQNLYEHSSRIPLIFAGPGVPKDQKVEGLCYLTDIFATLAEKTEVALPRSVQGINLNPAFKDPKTTLRPALYLVFKHFQRGIKKPDGLKLIEYHVKGVRHTQLFDLKSDPYEINNLADNKAYASKKESLRNELLVLRTSFNDSFSPFWDGFKF